MPTLKMPSEYRINLNCMDKCQLTDFYTMSIASSLYVNCSICFLFLGAVIHTHTNLYRHIVTDAGDLAHFDVTDSGKNGALESNNFKDEVDRIGALDLISFAPFLLPSSDFPFSLLSLIKHFLWEETMKEKPSKKGRRTIEGWRWSKL